MTKRHLKLTAATLAITAALSLAACGGEPDHPEETYDYQIDMNDYNNAITKQDEVYLLLANKKTMLGTMGYSRLASMRLTAFTGR